MWDGLFLVDLGHGRLGKVVGMKCRVWWMWSCRYQNKKLFG